jgi:hypothetical protein
MYFSIGYFLIRHCLNRVLSSPLEIRLIFLILILIFYICSSYIQNSLTPLRNQGILSVLSCHYYRGAVRILFLYSLYNSRAQFVLADGMIGTDGFEVDIHSFNNIGSRLGGGIMSHFLLQLASVLP